MPFRNRKSENIFIRLLRQQAEKVQEGMGGALSLRDRKQRGGGGNFGTL